MREIRIYDDAGASAYEPTLERVTDMIDALNPSNRFVIAERSDLEPYDQHFIQAYLEDDGSWSVEYRAGDEAHHFGTHLAPDTTELPGLLWSWMHDDEWRTAVAWRPLAEHDDFRPVTMVVRLRDADTWLAETMGSLLDSALTPTAQLMSIETTGEVATIVIAVRDVCWDQALAIVREVLDDEDDERWARIEVSRDATAEPEPA